MAPASLDVRFVCKGDAAGGRRHRQDGRCSLAVVSRDMSNCSICKRPLSVPADPLSLDCGGDCRRCMAEAGDTDCIDSIREIIDGRIAAEAGSGPVSTDAGNFLRDRVFTILPEAHFEDGILSLEWKSASRGAMLLFHGDGTVTTSVSGETRGYASGGAEIPVDGDLPEEFLAMMKSLARGEPQGYAPR